MIHLITSLAYIKSCSLVSCTMDYGSYQTDVGVLCSGCCVNYTKKKVVLNHLLHMPQANSNGSFDYQFGIHHQDNIYIMFDWVCGRFSLY
jgi:hypothetical protein